MSVVGGPGIATTPTPTIDPAFNSAGAIIGYIFGTLAVFLVLLCICIIIRRRRWRPARKYIKKQSERSVGLGPRLNEEQNGAKPGKAVSLKHLSTNGSSASSNGKIKPPKQPKPLAQTIKMERLNVRREAKVRKQVVKNARRALKRGEKPPLEDLLGIQQNKTSRPTSARSVSSTSSRPESANSYSGRGGLRRGATDRSIELPSLEPIINGTKKVPSIQITDETDYTPRSSRRQTVECEVYVHSPHAGTTSSDDEDSISSSRSRPTSASSRPGSAQSRSGRLSPTKPRSARGMRSSASSPAIVSLERSRSPLHAIVMDHSDIEEEGEDNPVFNLNTTEL